MKQRIQQLKNGIAQCLRNFPAETLLGIVFFILYIIDDTKQSEIYSPNGSPIHNMLFMFPTLFVVVYWCRTFFKKKYLYYLSGFLFIPLLFVPLNNFLFTIGYGFTLLLSVFLLWIEQQDKENKAFASNTFQTIYHLGLSAVFGLLFTVACWLIWASVLFIFGLESDYKYPEYMGMFTCFLITPLLFCYFQQMREEYWKPSKFIEIVLNFILSPAVIIYTVILYLYFIRIAWQGELPKGGIAYMVLAFVIVALGGRMAQLIVSRKYFDWFYRYFSFIAIPPLTIFWIGTVERIYTYSWTESRVYLFAAGILMTIYLLLLLSSKLGNYRLMLLISSVCIIVLTFFPFISAKQIGIAAQESRLERFARSLNLWDEEEQKLKDTQPDLSRLNPNEVYAYTQLRECFLYLGREVGEEKIVQQYGYPPAAEMRTTRTTLTIFNDEPNAVPDGYRFFLPIDLSDSKLYTTNDSIASITYQGKTVLSFNMNEQFTPYLPLFSTWKETSRRNPEPFIVCNDSCMLILRYIEYSTASQRFNCYGGTLFFNWNPAE